MAAVELGWGAEQELRTPSLRALSSAQKGTGPILKPAGLGHKCVTNRSSVPRTGSVNAQTGEAWANQGGLVTPAVHPTIA